LFLQLTKQAVANLTANVSVKDIKKKFETGTVNIRPSIDGKTMELSHKRSATTTNKVSLLDVPASTSADAPDPASLLASAAAATMSSSAGVAALVKVGIQG
jgi:hypothetical protein